MKILIYGKDGQHHAIKGIETLTRHMALRGIECCVEAQFYDYLTQEGASLPTVERLDIGHVPHAHLAISLGGDGTFLTTVMWVAPHRIPILGVNTGHLGYLTACTIDNACDMLDDFMAGRHVIEERAMLQVECNDVNIEHPYALNDIVITRHDLSAMLEMETRLNGKLLTTYKSDGLVVSTPTGSTAYSLSAGGPILDPTTACLILTPVSPHSLTMRPLVIPDDARIDITTHARSDSYLVSLDGESLQCPTGSTVTITRSTMKALVVQRRDHHFAKTLQQKLHWGV
ncbi:MAG: NAD(+)/NADH kinase [Muribaculaceae bacterium]|nr:NAD(+)/NADH kinase [Muribaculaceae bacterium]